MSLCWVHSCLLVSLSEAPDLPLGPAGCHHCFWNAAGQLGSRIHTATLTPLPSQPKTLLFPFPFCTAATSRHGRGNPQRPTEWSSVACRSRSRYFVRSPERTDDRARPFILIYCQMRGVDQLGTGLWVCRTHTSSSHHSKFIKTNLPPPRGPPLRLRYVRACVHWFIDYLCLMVATTYIAVPSVDLSRCCTVK